MVADGLFLENGSFFVIPEGDVRPCAELLRAYVLRMLRKKGLIGDGFIEMITKWRHVSGLSVYALSKPKREHETFDDGWRGFIEPVIDCNTI